MQPKKARPYVNAFLLGCSDCRVPNSSLMERKMTSGEPPAPTIGTMVKTSKFILNCFLNIINITHA